MTHEHHPTARPNRPRAALFVAAVAVLALVAACSGDDGTDASGDDRTGAGTERSSSTTVPEPERFEGTVEEFYEVPDPLPSGEPGQLIRTQEIETTPDEVTVRIMYRSRDTAGTDRAVTGVVTHPTGTSPEDGWPVIATAPGTVGLASQCAPSRQGNPPPAFGVEGVRVMTDYIGMGPVGETQAYLSRLSEGHSVLDSARAARQLVGDEAGNRLLVFGHSQGGHGAQAAHELAAEYAPELELLGTVSGAPAAMFDRTYGGVDDIVSSIVMTMGLYGVATDHPEIDPADYLAPDALVVAEDVLDDACLGEVINAFAPLAAPPYWAVDPATTEPAKSVLLANDVGNVAVDAPLLLISGTADMRVVHERVMDLFDRLCENGQVTELIVLEGADHDNETTLAADQIAQFYADRLAAAEPVDSCATTG